MVNGQIFSPYGSAQYGGPFISTKPPNMKLARAYIPYQVYTNSYPPAEALEKGTMFPELYSPWPTGASERV